MKYERLICTQISMNVEVHLDMVSVMIHVRTNIFLLSIFLDFIFLFLFIDDEEACDCGHMTCHMM